MIVFRSRWMQMIVAALAFTMVISGCDTVEGIRDMKDAQEQLKGLLEEEIGVETLVGFNERNGDLIDVSIGFNAEDVVDRSVSELVRAARTAIDASFDSKPRAIYLQISVFDQ